MVEFIVKYWVQFLFGLLIAGATALIKHHYSLLAKDIKRSIADREESMKETFFSTMEEKIKPLEKKIDLLTQGSLSLQRISLIRRCDMLLEKDHVITQEEWDDLNVRHDVYNSLGGNHDGDRKFTDVETKYKKTL